MKKRKKIHHKKIKKSHKLHKKTKKQKFSLVFNFGNQAAKSSDSKKPEKETKPQEKDVKPVKPIDKKPLKVNVKVGKILFEFLFWFGLAIIIASFLFQFQFYYNIVGLILMIGSLVQYFISQKKSTKLKKKELLKQRLEPKQEPIKKELKTERISLKEARKNRSKQIILAVFIIFFVGGIVFLLQRLNLLTNFYGISVLIIILFVILMVTLQNRNKTRIKSKRGLLSKPNLEIEKALKSLKTPETEIDLLLNYISLKKSVMMSTAARDFGVSRDRIEDWAKMLESHNLIRIYYPAVGDPSLRPVEIHKKEENGR